MPPRRRRPTAARTRGRARAQYLANRFGSALRALRISSRVTQATAAEYAGCSQTFWSRLERGQAGSASLEAIATAAAVVGAELAAFIDTTSGADLPRDIEHVRRQELVITIAASGGWVPIPEHAIDRSAFRSRSIDVLLERNGRKEAAVVEVLDFLDDIGATFRGLADKVRILARERPDWSVSGLLVVRATRRNRATLAELDSTFRARFPASSAAWLRSLTHRARAMPTADGLCWSSVRGDRLLARR